MGPSVAHCSDIVVGGDHRVELMNCLEAGVAWGLRECGSMC